MQVCASRRVKWGLSGLVAREGEIRLIRSQVLRVLILDFSEKENLKRILEYVRFWVGAIDIALDVADNTSYLS